MKKILAPSLAALALALTGCGNAGDTDDRSTHGAGDASLDAVIAQIGEVSTANRLLKNADLQDPFQGAGAYTIFLPDNAAFAKLPKEELELLESKAGRPEIIDFLTRHIAEGAISRDDLDVALDVNGGTIELTSVTDELIEIRRVDGKVVVGSGKDAPALTGISKAASNGVVYVIDGFIPPKN